MNIYGGIAGGVIGGLAGAAIWAVVGRVTNMEIGWIAWIIGAIVGSGVNIGMKGRGRQAGSVLAVVISVGAILLGKWAVVFYAVQGFTNPDRDAIAMMANLIIAEQEDQGRPVIMPDPEKADSIEGIYPEAVWSQAEAQWNALSPERKEELRTLPLLVNPDFILSHLADQVAAEFEEQNKPLNWPEGKSLESAWRKADYPDEVWAEALSRWDAKSPEEQEAYRSGVTSKVKEQIAQSRTLFESEVTKEGFLASFSPFDILWIILAVGTAWKLGYGRREEAAPEEPKPTGS